MSSELYDKGMATRRKVMGEKHIGGALNNGATPDEIMEVLHHATVYCGFPIASGAVRLGVEVFKERGLI